MGYTALVDWDGTLSRQMVGGTEANRDWIGQFFSTITLQPSNLESSAFELPSCVLGDVKHVELHVGRMALGVGTVLVFTPFCATHQSADHKLSYIPDGLFEPNTSSASDGPSANYGWISRATNILSLLQTDTGPEDGGSKVLRNVDNQLDLVSRKISMSYEYRERHPAERNWNFSLCLSTNPWHTEGLGLLNPSEGSQCIH